MIYKHLCNSSSLVEKTGHRKDPVCERSLFNVVLSSLEVMKNLTVLLSVHWNVLSLMKCVGSVINLMDIHGTFVYILYTKCHPSLIWSLLWLLTINIYESGKCIENEFKPTSLFKRYYNHNFNLQRFLLVNSWLHVRYVWNISLINQMNSWNH